MEKGWIYTLTSTVLQFSMMLYFVFRPDVANTDGVLRRQNDKTVVAINMITREIRETRMA